MARQITMNKEEYVDAFAVNDFAGKPVERSTRPDAAERWATMFAVENTFASFVAMTANKPTAITSEELSAFANNEFNPVKAVEGTSYADEKYYGEVVKQRSQRELDHLTQNIDRERRERDVIATMGGWEAAGSSLVAGFLDPTFAPAMLIPGVFATAGARFVATGAAGAGLATASEAALHGTQNERTFRESLYNVSGAFLIAGVLGSSLGSKFSPKQKAKWSKMLDEERNFMGPKVEGAGAGIGSDVDIGDMKMLIPKDRRDKLQQMFDDGEMTRDEFEMSLFMEFDEATKLKNSALFNNKFFKYAHPGLRLAVSKLPTMRFGGMRLAEDAYLRGFDEKGLGLDAQPVTTRIKMSQDARGTLVIDETLQRNYAAYLGTELKRIEDRWGIRAAQQFVNRVGTNKADFDEYSSRVMKAIMNGGDDVDPTIKSAAADVKKVLDRIDKEKREVGLLDNLKEGEEPGAKALHGDEGFYPRVINMDELQARGHDFEANVAGGFMDFIRVKYPKEYAQIAELDGLDALGDELIGLASGYRRALLKSPEGHIAESGRKYPKTGEFAEFLNGKQLDVSSAVLLKHEFIYTDLKASMGAYLRNTVPDIEITRAFGDVKMKQFFEDLAVERESYIDAAYRKKFKTDRDPDSPIKNDKGKLTKETKFVRKLQAEFTREQDLLENMRRYILHEYERPDNPLSFANGFLRKLKTWNVLTKLGGMTITSISDIGSAMMRVGFVPYAKTMIKFATTFSSDMPREQALKMAVGLDVIMNTRLNQIGMLDDAAGFTRVDKAFDKASKVFSKLTVMAQWNAAMKQFAALTIFDTTAILAKKVKLSQKDVRNLARMGINKTQWKAIRGQLKKYGTKEGGWEVPNTAKWDNEVARDAYEGAVVREADTAIVTPGPGDLPLEAYSQYGSMFFQFKTFMFAMQNKVLIPGIQQRDANTILGAGSMIGLGMASYAIKQQLAGKDISDTTIDQWLKEGVARSGVTGTLWGADTLLHDITGGEFSVQDMLFDNNLPVSRRMSESAISGLVGPWYGTIQDLLTSTSLVAKKITGGEVLESDVAAFRQMWPLQNLHVLKRGFDAVEEAAGGREFDKK